MVMVKAGSGNRIDAPQPIFRGVYRETASLAHAGLRVRGRGPEFIFKLGIDPLRSDSHLQKGVTIWVRSMFC
jgi:hypothetical protein